MASIMISGTKVDRSVTSLASMKDCQDDGYVEGDPAARISLVWEITQDTWAFMKEGHAQQRLQRDVTHLIRRTR